MDKAENRARQAFGACISAITAVNGVVYKLTAGSEVCLRNLRVAAHQHLY